MLKLLTVCINKLWKILKEMGIPDNLTCLLWNQYAGQEETVRTRHGTMDWFQIRKGVYCQDYILSPCLFNLYTEYIIWNAWLDEAQAGIKVVGRSINNLRFADDTTLIAESEEELKEPLDEGERGEWKSWFKTQHSKNEDHCLQSHNFMANIWQNNGNSDRLYFLGLQNHCRWHLQPWNQKTLVPWKKSYDNLDSILKIRDVTLLTKVWLIKALVFPVVMYWYESWTIKKAEH